MVQYGPLFHGPAGIAIPIGLPVLIVIGYLLRRDAVGLDWMEDSHDEHPDSDEWPSEPSVELDNTDAIVDD